MSTKEEIICHLTKKLSSFCADSDAVGSLYPKILENLKGTFSRCVLNSESNSMLVMGPRGSGKTVLVQEALRWLECLQGAKGNYSVVRLDGTVHTDDRSALKDITRQLQLGNVVGDRVFGSFAENLQFLLDSLKSGADRNKTKSSIFVLDNFERFTQHKGQTLLYNLFDVAQSQQAPMAVVGICCRLDTVELLEKRVKSRFAHRFLHVTNKLDEKTYIETAKNFLSLESSDMQKKFVRKWNDDLQKRVIPQMEECLVQLYRCDNTLRNLANFLQLMVRQVTTDLQLDPHIFTQTVNRFLSQDSKLTVIAGSPALQMVLLVCMLRLNAIYDGEPFNFELLFKEYMRFVHSTKSSVHLPKSIVFKAFENICDLELAQPVGGSLGTQSRYRIHHLHFSADLISEATKRSSLLPTDVSQWICATLSDKALGI